MDLFSQSLTILQKSLDVRMADQRVTSSNLANVDTPGYKAGKLDFEATMQQILDDPDAPNASQPIINPSADPSRTLDGNNVDLETELGHLSQNKLMYSVTTQLIANKFRQLNSVLSNGGGA